MYRENTYQFYIFNFIAVLFIALAINSKTIEYIQPEDCKPDEYFDTKSLTCIECKVEKNLEPSQDRLQCECDKKSKLIGFKNGIPICEECKSGTIPTSDRKDCIPCKKYNSTYVCSCPVNQITVERNLTGELLETVACLPCSTNASPSIDRRVCLPCNDIKFNKFTNCDCPVESHVKINQYCFLKNHSYWPEAYDMYIVNFKDQTFESYYLRMNLQLAIYLCKVENKTECEHLSNMCALTLYTLEAACDLFFSRLNSTSLFYKQEDFLDLTTKNISQKYSLSKYSNSSQIDIKVVKYSLKGTFESFDTLSIFKMALNIRFGVNIHKQQKLLAKELVNTKVEFFEPYIAYNDESKTVLHPVPILVRGLNKNKYNDSQSTLVKKFFLVDTVTGLETKNDLPHGNFGPDSELTALRYLQSLNIIIKVQSKQNHGKIFPPLLVVRYEELTKEQVLNNDEVLVDVKVSFVLPELDVNIIVQITVGVLSIFAIILSLLKAWIYCKRNLANELNISLLLWFLTYCLSYIGNVLLLVTISTCICTFIFYKGQTVLHIPLPNDVDEMTIHLCTIIAFCFKIVEFISVFYRKWNVDLYFIDWEQPKTICTPIQYCSPRTSLRKLFQGKLDLNESNDSGRKKTESPSILKKKNIDDNSSSSSSEVLTMNEDVVQKLYQKAPVSIWRNFFIINEFYQLQTERKISVMFQIISTLFILEVIGLKNWSLRVPELSIKNDESNSLEQSYTLHYGIGALVYIIIYCSQWLASIFFYETYIKNRVKRFVDLCSIANISVFILYFKYYGFYIHGRSVHGFADTDFETLMKDLEREEKNLCAHRGLIPGTIEQNFTVLVTKSFIQNVKNLADSQIAEGKRFLRKQYAKSLTWEKSLLLRAKTKRFLTKFIDHCFKDIDYVVKDRMFLEKLCDVELAVSTEKSVFYKDNSNSFDSVTLYGSECILGTFEIAIFVFTQALLGNYVIALLITFLVSQFFMIINKWNVKRNLIKKTLIDKRFLL